MKQKTILFIAILVATGFLSRSPSAHAVTLTEFTVELNVQPGSAFDRTMSLYDESHQGVTVYPTVTNFKEDPNQPGSALLVTDPNELKTDRQWVTFNADKIDLPADSSLIPFTYTVTVPADADPGTHLISLVFSTRPPDAATNGSSVSIGTNVVTNLFLRVAGAIVDSLQPEFKVGQYSTDPSKLTLTEANKAFTEKTFFLKPPVDFFVAVTNNGNVHERPTGNIKIQNDFFGKTNDKIPVNADNRILLPGSVRSFFTPSFGTGLMIGKYRAKLTLIYGDPTRMVTKELSFWIVPVKEIALVLALIILLIVVVIIWTKYARRRNEAKEKKKEQEIKNTLREEIKQTMREAQREPKAPAAPIVGHKKQTPVRHQK